jgi:hypothetical protein
MGDSDPGIRQQISKEKKRFSMETSDAGCWRGWGFGFDPFFAGGFPSSDGE